MGKEARLKEVRKQLRNIVKENFQELAKNELYTAAREEMSATLVQIRSDVNTKLTEIDNRSKDVQNFIMREMTSNLRANAEAVETPAQEALVPSESA